MSDATSIDEKQIFADWLSAFPLLKRHKGGRRLLRIYDPVVYGIELRKLGAEYRPEFVAMSLLTSWGGLDYNEEVYDRRHLQFFIDCDHHAQKYGEAVQALRARFPILSASDVDEQSIVDLCRGAYRTRMESGFGFLGNWEALVQILKYFGRLAEYEAEKRSILAYVRETPPATTTVITTDIQVSRERPNDYHVVRERVKMVPRPPYFPCKSLAEWEQEFSIDVDAPLDILLARRAERLAKGRWDKLPGVACAGYANTIGNAK